VEGPGISWPFHFLGCIMQIEILAYDDVLPFPERKGSWLELLRALRTTVRERKQRKKSPKQEKTADEKLMERIMQRMTPAQMAGYMKGLNNETAVKTITENNSHGSDDNQR